MSAYDLVVIGGGSAGLTAARTAGRLGARTLLVERGRLGGDCLWTGCVPSKALLHAAAEVRSARRAADYGLAGVSGPADLAAVMRRVRRAIAAIEPHDSAEALGALGVEVAYGAAVFTGPRTLSVGSGTSPADGPAGSPGDGPAQDPAPAPERNPARNPTRKVAFRYALIATGSSPALAPVPGLAEAGPLTSDTVWDLAELPGRLTVLGGGPTGCELAQAFARLGSTVTLVEARDRLLPREEPRASQLVRERLAAEGVRVLTGFHAERVADGELRGQEGPGAPDRPSDPAAPGRPSRGPAAPGDPDRPGAPDRPGTGTPRALAHDALLAVTGRRAVTGGLGLGAAGVEATERGEVRVDDRLRSSNQRIYAAGDVTGRSATTHLGGAQGAAAAVDALLGVRRPVDHGAVPWVTYTDPEVARVGLTAEQARERHGGRVRVAEWGNDRVDRAVADDRAEGFTSLVLGPRGRVVGATVVSPRAGETIAHLAAAVRLGWTASQYAATLHPYPTYADGPWHAALAEVYARLARGRHATAALLALRRTARR